MKVINKFEYSLKKQIVNNKKLYPADNGFISIISKKMTKDNGWLLENLVFNTINNGREIFYFSEKNECDFLIVENKKVTHAIQVCYELNEKNRSREISGISEAMDKFKLGSGIILTLNDAEEISNSGKQIKVVPMWKWLLEQTQ